MSVNMIPKLCARLIVERPVDTIDDIGSITRTWTFVAAIWGALKPSRSDGEFVASEQGSAYLWDVQIRWRPDVAAPMRFRIGDRILTIRAAIDPDARRRYLICRCAEFSTL